MASTLCAGQYIILRKIPFQESSLIVAGISPEFGRVDFLLKGARSVHKRKFPEAELFREFQVQFREPKNADGLANLISADLCGIHDVLSEQPEHYITACSCAAFLLKNTRPMLAIPDSYRAFVVLLQRLAAKKETEPWCSLAKFVFLYENGFVPKDDEAVHRVLQFALTLHTKLPDDRREWWGKFENWVENLIVWHNLK